MQQKGRCLQAKLSSAGKLWSDDNFQGCKMDVFCNEIIDSLEAPQSNDGEVRIFCAWIENWERKNLGPTGDPIFGARLVSKYGGLKWLDPDNNYTLQVAHPNKMSFNKLRGDNKYHILATLEGCDLSIPPEAQLNLYEVWWAETDWLDQVIDYYKDDDKVRIYGKGGECDSESDKDED